MMAALGIVAQLDGTNRSTTIHSNLLMSVLVQTAPSIRAAVHEIVSNPVALGLTILWVLMNVVIAIAAFRNAFDADRREQAIKAGPRTLREYSARALPVIPHKMKAGTPAKEWPADVSTTREE